MEPAIIVAVITVLGNLIISYLTNNKTQTLLEYKIDELDKKVQKHNNTIERVYKLEQDMTATNIKIENIYEEIDDLKHKGE